MVRLRTLALLALLAAAVTGAVLLGRRCSAHGRWLRAPTTELTPLIVDYTVPFDDYKEHRGLIWLLEHRKVRAPDGIAWRPARDYVGYRPDDRDHPQRLAAALSGTGQRPDLVYVADTYGVYRDDLADIAHHRAHMDYNPILFGGLDDADARALADLSARGATVVVEFNGFCEPTAPAPRAVVEALLGVTWTGWVGRVFADPHDTSDVPYWLPREFARQFPGQELPHSPVLALIDRDGALRLFPGPTVAAVAPRTVMSDAGRAAFPGVPADSPYYYWFGIVRAAPGTTVHASLALPPLPGLGALLASIGIPAAGAPLLTEAPPAPGARPGTGRRLQLAADLADLDFDPGDPHRAGAIADSAAAVDRASLSSAPTFWRFYAPIVDQLLRDTAASIR
jgi:hypothetical protein